VDGKASSGRRPAPPARPAPPTGSPPVAPPASTASTCSSTPGSATPTGSPASTQRHTLPAGDYGVALDDEIVVVVERKTVADLAGRLVDGQLAYALAELATLHRAAVVVEDRYADLLNHPHVRPGFLADQLAAVTVRYPAVPIVFCDTRPLAEEWTYRFLAAALTYLQAEQQST
jgi:hypothetical protein